MAEFEKGQVVWYADGDMKKELVVVVQVEQEEPAQYRVARTKDSTEEVCGEGENEPGAVSALS